MNEDRRSFLKIGAALAPALMLDASRPAQAKGDGGAQALSALGLDPLSVYQKMMSSTVPHSVHCWWYLGTTTMKVGGIGDVVNGQVETIMAFRADDVGPETAKNSWMEIGVFRNVATGELARPWVNPVTGKTEPRVPSFEDGPGHYAIRKAGNELQITLDQTHASVKRVSVAFAIEDDRVCLTQTEDKTRGVDTPTPNPIQTILKIYASLDAVKDPAQPSVAASGFYRAASVSPAAHGFGVTGLMQKTAADEKLNPIAWDRMKAAYPRFFRGDKVDPDWS